MSEQDLKFLTRSNIDYIEITEVLSCLQKLWIENNNDRDDYLGLPLSVEFHRLRKLYRLEGFRTALSLAQVQKDAKKEWLRRK